MMTLEELVEALQTGSLWLRHTQTCMTEGCNGKSHWMAIWYRDDDLEVEWCCNEHQPGWYTAISDDLSTKLTPITPPPEATGELIYCAVIGDLDFKTCTTRPNGVHGLQCGEPAEFLGIYLYENQIRVGPSCADCMNCLSNISDGKVRLAPDHALRPNPLVH